MIDEPDWVQHALWWQVFPLGATGAPAEAPTAGDPPVPRLRHLIDWLDHVVDLGLSGLALGPVFAAETHGYDTVDHFRIDPRLGTDDDFDALVAAATDRGIRVLLDGVFNHVGRGHPDFRRVLAEGPTAATANRFRLTWPDGAEPGTEPDWDDFEGHRHLVALNHDNPAVVDLVTRVMTHWLDRGAAGWRLDAAYAVPPRFWREVVPRVRASHPDAYLVGEVIQGDYPEFVRAAGIDAVTQYELWQAIWHGIADANFYEVDHALSRHNGFLDTFVPWTFVGNHDVTRIASQLSDERHQPHAHALLLLLGGTPAIYYGDEQGFTGVKQEREHGDDAVRPPLPPSPAELLPYGAGTQRLHQELISLRRRHPWLHTARSETLELSNTTLVLRLVGAESESLVLALNLADEAVSVAVAGERIAGTGVRAGDHFEVGGHGWLVVG